MVLLYSTFPNLKSAQKLAKTLVEKKVAGCVNLLPQMRSIYSWPKNGKDRIHEDKEIVMFIKTSQKHFSTIEKIFSKAHPYKVFCLFEFPIKKVSKSYAQWLQKNLV